MTVIGLTTYSEHARMLVWQQEFAMLHATYITATERAGGIALLLPPQGAVGVQWHPEENSEDVRLFAALVDAGQRYRQRLREGVS